MIVIMKPDSRKEHADHVISLLDGMGLSSCLIESAEPKVVEVLGIAGSFNNRGLENAPMVDKVLPEAGPLLAASRRPGEETFQVPLGARATVGGTKLAVIAGPCSVESETQLLEIACAVKEAGAVALRGGAFKPRTSPYSFQGHGERGLELLAQARERTGLPVVTEVMRCEHVPLVAKYADVLQIGSRHMHDTHLLTEVGRQDKPVLLKRGWSATLEEFLFAAEYIMLQGNHNVIMCERGIRTHETYVRNTLALSVVPEIKRISRLPIIVDPSHGTGRRHLVAPMSNAAVACGADGLLIEVHPDPEHAWSDGPQCLDADQFRRLIEELKPFASACRRVV